MKIKAFISFLSDEIFYNGHFQTWGSLAILISSCQLINISIEWKLLVIVYLSFYLLYLHDRYRHISSDSQTNIVRSQHVAKIYPYIPLILVFGLILLSVMLYLFSNIYASVFIILITSFGFLYPIYFKGLTKKIVAFKNFYVASVFSLLVLLPIVYYKVHLNTVTAIVVVAMLAFTFLRGLMMQFFLDIKDIKVDKSEGLLTLGVLWGKEKVYTLINIMNIFTSLAFPISYFLFPQLALHSSILFLTFLAVWNFFFFEMARRGNFFGFILGSGEFIYWPLFVFIGKVFTSFFSF